MTSSSLRRLKHISKKIFILWNLWYVSKIYVESICDYSKISHKNSSVLIKLMCGCEKHSKDEMSFSGSNTLISLPCGLLFSCCLSQQYGLQIIWQFWHVNYRQTTSAGAPFLIGKNWSWNLFIKKDTLAQVFFWE